MRIGVCGTGKMGGAIAERLLSLGHEVTVWNRDASKLDKLVAAGAHRAESPAALISIVEVVISMLLNEAAIEAVYFGPEGIVAGPLAGRLIIDMSTVLPATSERLAKTVTGKGAGFVECPVGGTVGPARNGQLLGLAGGTSDDVARAMPVLSQLCRRIEYVGPAGAGAKLKLAINLPLIVYWQALGESLALVRSLDITPERLIDILSDTSGAPPAMKMRGPDIAKRLAGQAVPGAAFDMSAARKDLGIMVEFGRSLGTELPVTSAALGVYERAVGAGFATEDAAAVATYFSQQRR